MFHYLSKFLPLFVYPVGLVCVLLALALLLRRRRRWQTVLIAVCLVVLWLGGNRLASMLLVRSLEWQYLPPETVPEAEAIVVLGGGTRAQAPPRSIHEMNEAGDRLLYAAWLYDQGAAPRVLVTGGNAPLASHGVPEAEAMAEILTAMGVPRDALLLEGMSRNTYENAVESFKIFEQEGIRQIILVTSAMHMPRAYRLFDQRGITVTPAPTDYLVTQQDWDFFTQPDIGLQLYNLVPTAEGLFFGSQALKEYIGIGIYWLRGWF